MINSIGREFPNEILGYKEVIVARVSVKEKSKLKF